VHKSISFTVTESGHFSSGEGFLYFDRRMFDDAQFNFTAQVAAGVQVFTSRQHSVQFGYEYHHISNANLSRINPGMDSHVMFVGLSFVRWDLRFTKLDSPVEYASMKSRHGR
jgi:opacity protein-like surface antigen